MKIGATSEGSAFVRAVSLPKTGLPLVDAGALPAVSADEMAELDRRAGSEFGIELAQMMELAGAALARSAEQMVAHLRDVRLTVLVGPGRNGGGGLVAARHLANRSAQVHVVLARPVNQLAQVARDRLATVFAMHVPVCVVPWDMSSDVLDDLLRDSDLVIDALLGYAAEGPPRGAVSTIIERAAAGHAPVLSLDLPSGIDPDTGQGDGPAITASATMTVALPKRGLLTDDGRARAGALYLADIGWPAALYRRAGLEFADPFVGGPIVRLS
jgi:NAD(P)H-hydrate epimerase